MRVVTRQLRIIKCSRDAINYAVGEVVDPRKSFMVPKNNYYGTLKAQVSIDATSSIVLMKILNQIIFVKFSTKLWEHWQQWRMFEDFPFFQSPKSKKWFFCHQLSNCTKFWAQIELFRNRIFKLPEEIGETMKLISWLNWILPKNFIHPEKYINFFPKPSPILCLLLGWDHAKSELSVSVN